MTGHGDGGRVEPPPGVLRGEAVSISVDGRRLECHLGESVAAALVADTGSLSVRTTELGEPRGLYCGMGLCFECLVEVDGIPNTRACVTWVEAGMTVRTQRGPAAAGSSG